MRSNNISRAIVFTTQTKTSINLKLLTNNSLKRKLRYLTNASRFLNIIETQKNTIANYLIKKSKSNLILLLFVSILISIKNSIDKADVL